MAQITKIEAAKAGKIKLRVAAYARVSTGSDDQLISLEAQKRHYEAYIKARPDWEFAGLYYDEGISGTKTAKREGLLKMIKDCEKGLIDYVIVKSISRFSRNTVDSIAIVRELQSKGVYMYFEKEYIRTGGNPLFSGVIRLFLCCFVAYLSLKSAKGYSMISCNMKKYSIEKGS